MKSKRNIVSLVLLLMVALPTLLFTTGCAKSKEKYIEILEGKGYTIEELNYSYLKDATYRFRATYEKDGEYGDVTLTFYSNNESAHTGFNQEKLEIARTKQYSPSYDFSAYWVGNVVMVGNEKGLKDAK